MNGCGNEYAIEGDELYHFSDQLSDDIEINSRLTRV